MLIAKFRNYFIKVSNWLFTLFLIFTFLSSCSLSKKASYNVGNSKSITINFKSENDKLNLKGLSVLKPDSSYFNVFGKLGVIEVNAAKVFVFNDSMVIVDLVNKVIYKAQFRNISQSIYNVFTGNYSVKEEQFVYTVCSLFLKNISKKDKPEIVYNFKNKLNKSYINLQIINKQINYFIAMRVLSNNKNGNIPFNYFNKYYNFENISIEFR